MAGVYVTSIVLINVAVGLLLAPRRTLGALRGATTGLSLFGMAVAYDSLLDLTAGELREALEVPREGLTTGPRHRHSHAPGV